MASKKDQEVVTRATLEATRDAQEKLREHLDELIKENRPINGESERKKFLMELTYSTLGMGSEILVQLRVRDVIVFRSSVEVVSRWAVYQSGQVVKAPWYLGDPSNEATCDVEYCRMWTAIRDALFFVFPLAISKAVALSAEREPGQERGGYHID